MVRLSFATVLFFGISALAGNGATKNQQKAVDTQGANRKSANANDGGAATAKATGKKPPGTQFITGPCDKKEDCASGCCAARDGKLTCAAPGALGVKDASDPKCNAKAGKAAQRLMV